MKLATLLIEIRRRSNIPATFHLDPLHEIHERCQAGPETLENKTLMRVARAIEERRHDFDDRDMWALGQESLRLLDALIERKVGPF